MAEKNSGRIELDIKDILIQMGIPPEKWPPLANPPSK